MRKPLTLWITLFLRKIYFKKEAFHCWNSIKLLLIFIKEIQFFSITNFLIQAFHAQPIGESFFLSHSKKTFDTRTIEKRRLNSTKFSCRLKEENRNCVFRNWKALEKDAHAYICEAAEEVFFVFIPVTWELFIECRGLVWSALTFLGDFHRKTQKHFESYNFQQEKKKTFKCSSVVTAISEGRKLNKK